MSGDLRNWDETRLWQLLLARDDPHFAVVRATLQQCFPAIQAVLAAGGTTPTNFTLHDTGHAFRVAERMIWVIPENVLPRLSTYELALLLLSAYLHDIGMTPEQRKVSSHYGFLLTGARDELQQNEIDEFQRWLDDEGYDVEPPLGGGQLTPDLLRLGDEIITYYCRHRHNDWSDDWIRRHLSGQSLGTYDGWLDDLVALCRSHHYSYHEIVTDRFNPRHVGSPGAIVHLRYLACVLRMADILEFDPERTPEVILRHRDIPPGSLIYWWKDKGISLVQENNRLLVSARPTSARIHRAIESTLDDVDRELYLCRKLADETHFEACPGLKEALPHRWDLLSSVHRVLTPNEGTYEYIDGAFRPDTRKILDLLAGIEFYADPIVAVRELLQNAFDAVREQIAYERLAQPQASDPELASSIAALHRVELRFDTSPDGTWLVCTDNGVGMTKAIIRDHLLVAGAARRHDILALERRCKKAGFQLGRTGQFGIGVLAYFMLADHVTVRTRRSQDAGDSETVGWVFETEGVGSFGELRSEAAVRHGTQVRLHLRSNLIKDAPGWYAQLSSYVLENLVHIPCEFQLNSALPGCKTLSLQPGWVQPFDFVSSVVSKIGAETSWASSDLPDEIVPAARREEREAARQHVREVRSEATRLLRCVDLTGELPDGLAARV